MKSYVIPTKGYENDLVILHCDTNNLRTSKEAKDIADEIIDLALDMKTKKTGLMILGIVPRRDKYNAKGMEVNKCLSTLCTTYNFHYIDNCNINTDNHVNTSSLHLNFKGTYVLGSNFVNAIEL